MDNIPFQNLTLGQDKPKVEPLEVTGSPVPPPMASATGDDNIKGTNGGLTEQELTLQREEEGYDRIYVSLISKEEESNIKMDKSMYNYVTCKGIWVIQGLYC